MSALHGGVAATVAGVALHCATKPTRKPDTPCSWGWGFAQVWRNFFFCVFFCSGFHLPDKRIVQTGSLRRFLVRRFLRPFLRRFLVRRFCAHFCADFWCADFAPIFAQTFGAQIFARRLAPEVLIGVPESRKNAQKMRGESEWPCSGGHPIPSPLSQADSTSHNCRWADILKESM